MKKTNALRGRHCIPAFSAALLAAGLLSATQAQTLQQAGAVFVDIDATTAPLGPLNSIPNVGTLSGVFAASGGGTSVPEVKTIGGTKAIDFDGGDFLRLETGDGTIITAPAELTGLDPTRSIEVWALNPALANEEAMVSWGHRGGNPDGSNMSFNYGSDFRWGAVGHWGNRDIGWNNQGNGPAANKWHHLVYTYDGTTTRVYSDGVLVNGEYLGPGAVDTFPDTQILIGAQTDNDGATVFGTLRFSGAIARVRVHDGVLTPEQVAANYNLQKADFIDPTTNPEPTGPTPEKITVGPVHRYSFNETAGDATDQVVSDSVGDADGVVLGAGGTFTGSRLSLPGGSSASAAYVDLPNGLLSSHSVNNGGSGKFALEAWVKVTGTRNWSRIFDFGSSLLPETGEAGEVFGPGGGGEGRDYFMWSAHVDTTITSRRLEVRNEDPAGGGIVTVDNPTVHNRDLQLLVTWDEATGQLVAYENGVQVSTVTTDDPMSDINDVNVWLGRSNWTGDQNVQAEFDEVRIYDYILTAGQVLGNFYAGPNELHTRDFAPTFLVNPADVTTPQGQAAEFVAAAYGSAPVRFQWLRDGVEIPNETNRIYRLAAATINDNNAVFTVRASNTVDGQPASVTSTGGRLTVVPPTDRLVAGPVHRWNFNETAGDATGAEFRDSIGTAHGVVHGEGATFTGTRLRLPGGSSQTAAYGDLPNGILSSHSVDNGGSGKFSIEGWFRITGANTWGRVFDFGSSGTVDGTEEVFGPGGGGEGRDYFAYTSQVDQNTGARRFEIRNEDPAGGGITTIDHTTTTHNTDTHVVITWDEATGALRVIENGVQVASTTTDDRMSDINDVNVWLGRSNWTGDQNAQIEFDELRIYDYVLSSRQALGNLQAGKGVINNQDIAPTIVRAPQSVSVPEGAELVLSVEAQGSTPMAYQWLRDGQPIQGEINPTLRLTNIGNSENNVAYSVRVSNTVNGTPTSVTSAPAVITVQPYVVALRHRYSFTSTDGITVEDLVGTADGTLIGGGTFESGQLALNGIDGYVDLPNGIISGLGMDGTIELWVTSQEADVWTRIFDFGRSDLGEEANNGVDYLFLTPRMGDGFPRFVADFPDQGNIVTLDPAPPGFFLPDDQQHVVITWSASRNVSRMYFDGVLVASGTAPRPLSDLAGADINNWLGRSQFIADAYWEGQFDEVRLSAGAMSPEQVQASFQAGPGNLPDTTTRPELDVARNGNNLVISWPASATGFALEASPVLGPGENWQPVAGATQVGNNMQATVPLDGTARFFRLRKP